jgi:hypothetical protein
MPPDVVQIGPLVISKAVLDAVAPLLGTLIGGLITYLATRAVEKRKWEQEKRDRLQEHRREAIGLALEWIAPIHSALTQASLCTRSYLLGIIDVTKFMHDWPKLLSALASKDLPARMQVHLPSDAYARGQRIIIGLDRLMTYNLVGRVEDTDDLKAKFNECFSTLEGLSSELDAMENNLKEEYRRTYQ